MVTNFNHGLGGDMEDARATQRPTPKPSPKLLAGPNVFCSPPRSKLDRGSI